MFLDGGSKKKIKSKSDMKRNFKEFKGFCVLLNIIIGFFVCLYDVFKIVIFIFDFFFLFIL